MSVQQSCQILDRIDVTFDDEHVVADAGLLLPATLAAKLGVRELIDDYVSLEGTAGHANRGLKGMSFVFSALMGGDHIDDTNMLRAAATSAVLGHEVRAPSTLGTYLRSYSWGNVRQLERVLTEVLRRVWEAGAGPDPDKELVIDIDSTICETYGLAKVGASFGYTKKRGYHPQLAVVAGTGDVVGVRLRGGAANTARAAGSFITETTNRVRRAGATGPIVMRADSGFYTTKVVQACTKADVKFSIGAKITKGLHARISQIRDDAWTPIPYWIGEGADVAEIPYTFAGRDVRLIIRRVKPTPGSQLALITTYSYHALITDRDGETVDLETDHRNHAVIENTIRDLKYGVGWNHMPSGRFAANGAWIIFNVLAHNLARWTSRLGLGIDLATTKTLRTRYFKVPGRLTRSARRRHLSMPNRWPWTDQFLQALDRIRNIPKLA